MIGRLAATKPIVLTWVLGTAFSVFAAIWHGGWKDPAARIDGDRAMGMAVSMGLVVVLTFWPWVRWGTTSGASLAWIAVGSFVRVAGTVALFVAAGYHWTSWLVAAAWVLTWYGVLLVAEIVALTRYLKT